MCSECGDVVEGCHEGHYGGGGEVHEDAHEGHYGDAEQDGDVAESSCEVGASCSVALSDECCGGVADAVAGHVA